MVMKHTHRGTKVKARDNLSVIPAKGNKNTVALRKKLKTNWR
jgi:hypothetical protein